MNWDLVLMAALAGLANWGFRALPVLLMRAEPKAGGLFGRFLASTGPAAIATLFIASVMGQIYPEPKALLPLVAGIMATLLAFLPKHSVVGATLAGSCAYGLAFAFFGG